MTIQEQLWNTILTGEPMSATIPGVISFSIYRRNIPVPLPPRPVDLPKFSDSKLPYSEWKSLQIKYNSDMYFYNLIRLQWIEERKTVAKLERILKMVEGVYKPTF